MYDKFTDRARKVMQLASQEAQRFNHEYIGTEHILLGLVKEGSGLAVRVLRNLDVDIRKIRLEVEKIVKGGPGMVTPDRLPLTPPAKKVIEFAIEESQNHNHNYVGTEHLLLGLLRVNEGVASQVLQSMSFQLELDAARKEVLQELNQGDSNPIAGRREGGVAGRFEYKFVRFEKDSPVAGYQEVVEQHASEGWRLVQIFTPPNRRGWGGSLLRIDIRATEIVVPRRAAVAISFFRSKPSK
jgi:ATP-dependent Clp protease ATP-binding subunit ClpA